MTRRVRTLVVEPWSIDTFNDEAGRAKTRRAGLKGTQRGAARPRLHASYSRPEERKRVTGSMIGTGCR